MAEYHVGCGVFGIYAGTLDSKNKNMWRNKTDVTEEAICAVAQHLLQTGWCPRIRVGEKHYALKLEEVPPEKE